MKTPLQKNFFRLLLLHRRLGLVLVWVVLWLVVTGVLLNHSEQLKLKDIKIQSPWLLQLYGLAPASVPETGFVSMHKWWVAVADGYDVDGLVLSGPQGKLVGGVALPEFILVATEDAVLVFNTEGEPIETLGALQGLNGTFQRVGLFNNQAVLQSSTGLFISSLDAVDWQPWTGKNESVSWSELKPLPERIKARLKVQSLGMGGEGDISLEKLVLDLHSGRLLGSWSWLLLDVFALLLLSGAVSGLMIWYKLRAKK